MSTKRAERELSYRDNELLQELPAADRDRLLLGSKMQHLNLQDVLFEPYDVIESVYFPVSGMVSLVTPMSDGKVVEMATIGHEGVVGVPMLLKKGVVANVRAISQVEGDAIAVTAHRFLDERNRGGALAAAVDWFELALYRLVGQIAACNRVHTMHQRCARWLLMTHDRVGADSFHLTQEFLSQMLGCRRSSVTVAVGALRRAGAIEHWRGTLTIVDRAALEAESCECYEVIQRAFIRPP